MDNKLTDPNPILTESTETYFTDMYSAWEVKEQLIIGQEVAEKNIATGIIDTSDTSLTKVDNIFRLSVADPDGKIFSMTIDWLSKTFYIGFFWNTALAYSTLETELQAWLWVDYIVEYDTGTFFNLSRVDGQAITYSNPSLVRNIALSGYDSDAKIDVIIDWTTYTLTGTTYANSTIALDYLVTTLTGATYFVKRESTNLVIARQDGAIPTITKTQYNRYTHELKYRDYDTPNSGQYPNNATTTVDSIQEFTPMLPVSRRFNGDWIIRNLVWNSAYTVATSWGGGNNTTTSSIGYTLNTNTKMVVSKITKITTTTATRALIKNNAGTTLATASFSWDVATFNYTLDANTTYRIEADNNGSNYNSNYSFSYSDTYVDGFCKFGMIAWVGGNIASIEATPFNAFSWYTTSSSFVKTSWGSDSIWNYTNKSDYFGNFHSFFIRKSDYSSITASSVCSYTVPWSFPNDTGIWYSFTQTNHLADITITTYTEIVKSLTLLSNNFYIRTGNYPQNIKITAVSSAGSSTGEYKRREQSCTAKYGATTEVVADKIFKTDASNYGNIVIVKRGGFVITWTTNTSNKLDYVCE